MAGTLTVGRGRSRALAAGLLGAAALGLVLLLRLQSPRPPGLQAGGPAAARAGAFDQARPNTLAGAGAAAGGSAAAPPGPAGGGQAAAPGSTAVLQAVAVPVAPEDLAERERETAGRLQEAMGRLVSDLEFTPGLREPLQQTVVKPPDPWTPPADAGAHPPPDIAEVSPGSAPAAGGVLVTIRGRNLRAPRVVFGSRPARVFGGGADFVTVEVPPARAGPVTIAVTNDDGSWALSGQPFTYLE